jgi:Arc/MetJ family transcription regulator
MEMLMSTKFYVFIYLILPVIFSACGGKMSPQAESAANAGRALGAAQVSVQAEAQAAPALQAARLPAPEAAVSSAADAEVRQSLDEIAALERAGAWFQGIGLKEAVLKENSGDDAGAVIAAYKELSWAYGRGGLQKADIEKGLINLLEVKNSDAVVSAANAILAFEAGNWAAASAALEPLFDEQEEPDGFGRWMILVCALELNRQDRRAAAAYKAIRARYTQFPEYWYRGARAFTGAVAAEYAENCINLSAQGSFTGECRKILASFSGVKNEDSPSIKTKIEIENVISQSLNTGNPRLLEALFPLIGLPDNPYTIYAVGALRALTGIPGFREFFNRQADASSGRLSERLAYICRS